MVGHRLLGFVFAGNRRFLGRPSHFDQAVSLYDPGKHRPLATLVTVNDIRCRSCHFGVHPVAAWLILNAALTDVDQALKEAREIGHAPSLIDALFHFRFPILAGRPRSRKGNLMKTVVLAEEKSEVFLEARGTIQQGVVLDVTGEAADGSPKINSGISQYRSTDSTLADASVI